MTRLEIGSDEEKKYEKIIQEVDNDGRCWEIKKQIWQPGPRAPLLSSFVVAGSR